MSDRVQLAMPKIHIYEYRICIYIYILEVTLEGVWTLLYAVVLKVDKNCTINLVLFQIQCHVYAMPSNFPFVNRHVILSYLCRRQLIFIYSPQISLGFSFLYFSLFSLHLKFTNFFKGFYSLYFSLFSLQNWCISSSKLV